MKSSCQIVTQRDTYSSLLVVSDSRSLFIVVSTIGFDFYVNHFSAHPVDVRQSSTPLFGIFLIQPETEKEYDQILKNCRGSRP
jgi:hypothetical protein